MEQVRNSANRLVCEIDKANREVVIIIKGCKTIIRFLDDGTVAIINAIVA